MSDTPRRILVYLALILGIAAAYVWIGGEAIDRGNLVAGLVFAPIAAVLLWWRWDHAPAQGAKRRATREAKRKQRQ